MKIKIIGDHQMDQNRNISLSNGCGGLVLTIQDLTMFIQTLNTI